MSYMIETFTRNMAALPNGPSVPRYILVLVQHGDGCDYTIGCGLAVKVLKATEPELALAEAADEIQEYGGSVEIEQAYLLKCGEVTTIDVSTIPDGRDL